VAREAEGDHHFGAQRLTMEIKGRNLIEGMSKTITIDDSEIRESLSECVATIMNAIRVALAVHGVFRRHHGTSAPLEWFEAG
jgi:actin-like ATPase involved in cell morphogenesis